MKQGRSLGALAEEVHRQATTKKDYIAHASELSVAPVREDVRLELRGIGSFGLNALAHRQFGDHLGIPSDYYDRMRTKAPELLARNANHWLGIDPSKRMVRTLDSRARAFLSDRFRPLDHYDLCEAILPVMAQANLDILSCEITERRLYIKAVERGIVREVNGRHIVDGRAVDYDHVSPSLTVSNSEVGEGLLSVEKGCYKHGCRNMAMFRERSLRKMHVGARHALSEGVVAMLSDRTKNLTDAATFAQVADVVRATLNPEAFEEIVNELRVLTGQPITGDVPKVVELAARQFGITKDEKASVLRHLIEGGDLSRFGLFNAVTRTAEDLDDYDRATDFERMGGGIIELPANDWKRIAEAA